MTVFLHNFSLDSLSVTEGLLQESTGQRAAIFSVCKKRCHLVKKFYVYNFYCIILAFVCFPSSSYTSLKVGHAWMYIQEKAMWWLWSCPSFLSSQCSPFAHRSRFSQFSLDICMLKAALQGLCWAVAYCRWIDCWSWIGSCFLKQISSGSKFFEAALLVNVCKQLCCSWMNSWTLV